MRILLTLIAIALAMFISGCGGDDKPIPKPKVTIGSTTPLVGESGWANIWITNTDNRPLTLTAKGVLKNQELKVTWSDSEYGILAVTTYSDIPAADNIQSYFNGDWFESDIFTGITKTVQPSNSLNIRYRPL